MIKKIFIQHNLLTSIIAGIVSISCIFAFAQIVEPSLDPTGTYRLMDLQLAFTKERGEMILGVWGTMGRSHFLKTVWIDFVFPVAYAVFLSSMLILVHRKKSIPMSDSKVGRIIAIPAIIALLDMIENTFEILFVDNPDLISDGLFFFHSTIASIKWAMAAMTILYLFFNGVILIRRKMM